MSPFRILVINPGSTTTKIAIYENHIPLLWRTVLHDAKELEQFGELLDQTDYRIGIVLRELGQAGIELRFDAVIGRGGLMRPLPNGVYEITAEMCDDIRHSLQQHPCNLGTIMASELARHFTGSRALTAAPGVVEERSDVARICGAPQLKSAPIWHAMSHKAIAQRYASERDLRYEDLSLIICHLGGGISVAAHHKGRAIDVNNCLEGEGPFSLTRSGTIPSGDLVRLCFSGKYTEQELLTMISSRSGMLAHLGTTNIEEAVQRIEAGDEKARLVVDAMIYQTAKRIASMGATLLGRIDAILITGEMAHCDYLIRHLRQRIDYLGPVRVYPGEFETEALAAAALAALEGRVGIRTYG